MNNFIGRLRGVYLKSDYKKQALFNEVPTTSSQDIALNRCTDTSMYTEYPNHRYKYINKIMHGSASSIYKAYDRVSGKHVIIKKIKKHEYWRKELEILKYISGRTSNRILKYVDHYESQKRSYIITEFYDGYDLYEHIDLNAPYETKTGLMILLEMAKCIKECHDNNIVHLDIKCENYMVNSNYLTHEGKIGKIILLDFGHADIYMNGDISKKRTTYSYGTLYYLCPEGYCDSWASSKSDIWSLGVCMSIILTGDYPFLGSSSEYYRNTIVPNIYLTKEIPHGCNELLSKMLSVYPCNRPDINQVIASIELLLSA